MGQLPEDGKPSTIKPLDNGLEIECVYDLTQYLHLKRSDIGKGAGDGHKSTYTYEWLKNHTSSSAAPTERPSIRCVTLCFSLASELTIPLGMILSMSKAHQNHSRLSSMRK